MIAITSGLRDMQAVLNLVWDNLLPAMDSKPLPADEPASTKLAKTLQGLKLRIPESAAIPPKVLGKKYVFASNNQKLDAITLSAGKQDGEVTLDIVSNDEASSIACGSSAWRKTRIAWGGLPEQPAAACGAWTADDIYTAKFCFYETPFVATVQLKLVDGGLKLTSQTNVGFGPNRGFELVGKTQ